MITVYRMNTGSCGGCDAEIAAAIASNHTIAWVDNPADADLVLLTGPLTVSSRPVFLAIWKQLEGRVPLLAVGRCAIDGHPFGKGGVAELPDIKARLLEGCPPAPKAIIDAITQAVQESH